jgi:hypothetical protein
MATLNPEELAEEIAHLSQTATTRVIRLSPELRSGFQSLLRGDTSGEVEAAVEAYFLAAKRAESHLDAGARQAFEKTDAALAKHLSGAGRDEELLRRELAQRRAALLTDPQTLAQEAEQARRQTAQRLAGGGRPDIDVVAARMQSRFLERIRQVASEGQAAWTPAKRLLMRGFGKLQKVIGGAWAEGWEAVFTYLRENEAALAERAKELQAAVDELAAAEAAGDVARVAAANGALSQARSRIGGYRSKIKGLLGEAYAPRWQSWLISLQGYLEIARRSAASLPGEWEVVPVVGDLRLEGKEVWDQAILLVRQGQPGRAAEARLFLAAQFKVEKQISALEQIENDVLRETTPGATSRLPVLTVDQSGRTETYLLTPMSAGEQTHRLLFNAAGGKLGPTAINRLQAAGIEVHQMNLDVSLAEMDSVVDTLIHTVGGGSP